MNIKEDPGCGPGFERSVNAEPGPMGAGAGAAAAIDNNEPSPRGAAIEKAQAELRRDLAVREERRRELEFLEKGGEPLDFKFGEAPVVKFSPLSPKEGVVDGSLPWKSAGEGVLGGDVVIDGDLSNGSKGCSGAGEGVGDMSVALVPGNEQACSRLGLLDVGAGDPSWALIESGSKTDVDSCHGRPKGGGHVNRSRVRSQRVGNGHALSKEVEGVVGGDRQVAERESTSGPGTVENEDVVDMSYQVLPHQSQHGLPGKWNGLSTSQGYEAVDEIMARCGPVLEQHPSDHSSRDRASLASLKSLQASDVRAGSRAVATGRDSERSSVGGECSPYEAADRADSHEQAVGVGERRDGRGGGRQAEGVSGRDAGGADSTRICRDDAGAGEQGTERRDGVSPAVCWTGVGVEKLGDSGGGPREVSGSVEGSEARGGQDSRSQAPGDGSRGGSAQRDPRVVKKAGGPSRGGSQLRVARGGAEERKVNVHHVRLKVEDGVADDRAKHLATQAEPGGHESNGAHSQELRTGAQAGAAVGGAPRSMGRSSSNSGTPNCKYPVPWEKGQDSVVQAEAERLREKLANKAREDFILEEAEHLKVKRKLLEERKTMKPVGEPGRRKSHWDYVLEEMKWMANDFWQERMWKRYQAAHVCLEIAMKKGEDDFLAAELTREQHRVARILAGAVKDFWRTAEVAVTKEKSDSRSSGQEQGSRRAGQSEVVPMDVDFPVTREAPEKPVRHEKAGKEQLIGVQKYAILLLREWGFLRVGQAEAPPTPERQREGNSILDQVREVPLLYEVPMGSLEAYRAAVEAERARAEEEHERRRAAASAEAEGLGEAGDDASAGGDVSYADLSNDGGSQEDEPAIFTTEGSRISRKKRKKIFKTSSIGSRGEGGAVQGLAYRAPGSLSSEAGVPSALVTGKRSLAGGSGGNSLPGSIPVKRARSSAANLRPRGTQAGASPGGYMAQRGSGSQFQQDDGMDALDGSNEGDGSSDTPGSKGGAGDGRVKKKKKTRPYPALSPSDGVTAADTPAKSSDGIAQDVRHEQMKRKADTHWVSIAGSDAGLDTPGTPGSQGVSGQQNSKKQKSLRQAETNSEAGQAGQQAGSAAGANKLLRQSSMRDRNRRVRPATKVPPSTPTGGVGIPWSAGEDQAILALVHDLGANWELVSDVLSSNSQIKGICRKPQQCKERHKALTERAGSEGLENTEDPSSSQPQASKGNMRGPRGQSAAEEDTLKHFEQIIIIVQKYGARKNSSESEDQKVLQASHSSHGIIMSQFWTGIGGTSNPVDLADRVTGSDDPGAHPHPAQAPQGNVLGPPMAGPMAGLGMRPPAGGLPLVLPGPSGLHGLGQGSLSPAAMSAAARDAQRLNMSSFSNEEHARLQMVTKQLSDLNARRAQQQAVSAAAGVPVLGGLANSNGLPMLSTSTSGGMLVGLNRGLSLPRAGLAGMGSPVVSSMGTAGLSGRLPPSGNLAAASVSRRIAGLVNMARNAGCTEEQRLQALQQLQSMAQQGDGQAGAGLASLTGGGGDMGNPVDGLNQPFSLHHQHPLQQQQQQSQEQHQQLHQQQLHHMSNSASKLQAQVQQHGHQMQLPGGPQAYVAVPTRMKEQQQQQQQLQRQQQQLQQLHKQKLLGNLAPNPQGQHMLVPPHQAAAAAAASLPGQHLKSQPHILPPQQHNSLQKQLMQQVGSPSQGAQLSAASSSLQSSPASPGKAGQQSSAGQQNERAGQMAQGSLAAAKPPQANQSQKQLEQTSQMVVQQQQLQAMRNSKGVSRGAMLMQGPPAQAAQASSLGGGGNGQPQVEGGGQMQAGQRGAPPGQAQGGKAGSGGPGGNPGGGQSQGGQGGQVQGPQAQTASSVVGGQKGGQQQSAQGGAGKQQLGGTSQAAGQSGGQQAGPASASGQHPAAAASSGGPNQQQVHRRQVAQAQAPRRSQTKHPSTSMGAAMGGLVGKTGGQAGGPGAPPQIAQAGQNPYQFGGTIPMGMGNSSLHGIALSSALNSSTVEAQSTHWKPNQTLPPLGGGIYNLTRGSSPGGGQGPALVSAALHSNGNVGTSSLSSPGVQGVGGVKGSPGVLSQNPGAGAGTSGRGLAGPQLGGQRSQPSGSVPLPSGAGNTASHQARPSTASSASTSPTISGGVAASQGGTAGGATAPTASSGQARQAHGEHASSSASAASTLPRATIAGASGSGSSGGTIPPPAAEQGGPASGEPTAASSS